MKKAASAAVFLCLLFCVNAAYALDLQPMKVHFLKGDYKAAIKEGERLLASADKRSSRLDELYYYLAISYLKEGNLLRAADIFDIILKEFKKSPFTEQAKIGLIDYELQQGNYKRAAAQAEMFLKEHPRSKFRKEVQERLKKSRDVAAGAAEERTVRKAAEAPSPGDFFVQVGAFSSKENAGQLAAKLGSKGYSVFVHESVGSGKALFKVRVGPYVTRREAQEQSEALRQRGFPTKVVP